MKRVFTDWRYRLRWLILVAIALCLILFFNDQAVYTQTPDTSNFPTAKVHSLPQSLAAWNSTELGNYFEQIESTPLGYLIWTHFPLKVYIDSIEPDNTAANQRFQQWTAAAQEAIAEWNEYLPLKTTETKDQADIVILRSQPKREAKLNPDTGLFDIPRAIAAQTNYKFYLSEEPVAMPTASFAIAMKMTVEVSSNFTGVSLLATMRHELGHALGIWGHSPNENDALYYSQVSNPVGISARDINTLKEIYQQPTKLGWQIE
ncbi:MAG: matrixin family metalloprotease [Cyanobacteria bacterium J06643_13]